MDQFIFCFVVEFQPLVVTVEYGNISVPPVLQNAFRLQTDIAAFAKPVSGAMDIHVWI